MFSPSFGIPVIQIRQSAAVKVYKAPATYELVALNKELGNLCRHIDPTTTTSLSVLPSTNQSKKLFNMRFATAFFSLFVIASALPTVRFRILIRIFSSQLSDIDSVQPHTQEMAKVWQICYCYLPPPSRIDY